MSIHPTAVIGSNVNFGTNVSVGPYAVIEDGARIGDDCVIGPHVVITGFVTLGSGNVVHAGASIGDAPQDLKFDGSASYVRIGDRNVIREHCTIHRAQVPGGATIIGDDNFFMALSHVGHDSHVGNRVILANGAVLGGHAEVGDRAFLSAMSAVHQFARVGRLSLLSHNSGAGKDVPPFVILTGYNLVRGLNVVGLRRAGFTPALRSSIKSVFDRVYRCGDTIGAFLEHATEESSPEAQEFADFVRVAYTSRRGLCRGPRPSEGTEEASPTSPNGDVESRS
jgi:UDP-N-acetylglucosamine acyltransferase